MSKKIAEGTGSLVLDVKVGTGAFMKDLDRARELASTMVALGKDAGVHTVALLTDMSTPLGLHGRATRSRCGVRRGARRRRTARRRRAHRSRWPGRCSRAPAATTSTPPRCSRPAGRWTRGGR